MKIAELYGILCRIYGIEDMLDIESFILTDEDDPCDVSIGNGISGREALLIRESKEGLEIGLFISPEIISVLDESNPLDHLDSLSCAAEGVSHFLYLCDRVQHGKSVTKLELELQAEVDKFLVLHLMASEAGGSVSPDLFSMQFERHSFDPDLDPSDELRYREASRFAAKYCHHLLTRYFNPLRLSDLLPKARDFFGRDLVQKVEMLTP